MTQTKQAQNIASTKRVVSPSTEALITAKCQLSDLHSLILNAMVQIYGDSTSDQFHDEIYETMKPLSNLTDRYIIESITCAIGTLDSTEF